jgi:FkbM family methyltransferase
MNLLRFLKKCVTNPSAAWRSAKLVARDFYGQWYWRFYPNKPLLYRMPQKGILWLEPGHSFTHCFYPGVDQYEPDVQAALKYLLKPGHVFVDCGANVGYFSVLAGGLVGKTGQVIAIEANPITYPLLERNLKSNHFGTPIHCALTTQIGEIELFMPAEGDVYSSLRKGGLVTGDSIQSFKVQGRNLDDILRELPLTKVDVLKIDIEGAELDVLRSATYVLSTFRPIVIVEYGTNTWPTFGATPDGLKTLLREHHYELRSFDYQTKRFVETSEEIWKSSYTNLFLCPKEHFSQ